MGLGANEMVTFGYQGENSEASSDMYVRNGFAQAVGGMKGGSFVLWAPPAVMDEVRWHFNQFRSTLSATHHMVRSQQRNWPEEGPDACLSFSNLSISVHDTTYGWFYDPLEIQVTATVTNVSEVPISAECMPHLFCAETRELFPCNLSTDVLKPQESAAATCSITARDVFTEWLLFQQTFNGEAPRPVFSGLDGLPKLVTNSLQHCADSRRGQLEAAWSSIREEGEDTTWLEYSLGTLVRVTDTGECFHSYSGCGNSMWVSTMRLRQAYKGYSRCSRCFPADSWRSHYDISSDARAFWLMTSSGTVVVSWNKSDFQEFYKPYV